MSNRNTSENKKARREARANRACRNQPRTPSTDLPLEVCTELLMEKKMTGPVRRALIRGRELVVVFPRTEPTAEAVKVFNRLSELPIDKVARRRTQAARRFRKLDKLALRATAPRFEAAFRQGAAVQLSVFKQADAEINARLLHATDNLKQA